MDIDFAEEELPRRRYILKISRHKVPGGWYVRVIFTEFGHGAGGRNESAIYIPDPEYSWKLDGFRWQMIKKDPVGGVYRAKVPGGWLLLGTARGQGTTADGTKLNCRMGSLVFVPDPAGEWECKVIEEKNPFFGDNK